MKRVASLQPHPGETDICDIQPNQKSRDDLPAVLRGVQCVCCDRTRRPELFVLIEEHVRPGTDRDVGRRGRDLWEVLVVCILAARPELGSCSFGEGFHSRAHRAALYGTLKLNAPPRKGRLTGNDLGEGAEEFVQARRQYPAVESAIDNLEGKGLSRVTMHGRGGFQRTVLAAPNLLRIGSS